MRWRRHGHLPRGLTVSSYNSVRLHSKLGNLPPKAFEQKSATIQPIRVCEIT